MRWQTNSPCTGFVFCAACEPTAAWKAWEGAWSFFAQAAGTSVASVYLHRHCSDSVDGKTAGFRGQGGDSSGLVLSVIFEGSSHDGGESYVLDCRVSLPQPLCYRSRSEAKLCQPARRCGAMIDSQCAHTK